MKLSTIRPKTYLSVFFMLVFVTMYLAVSYVTASNWVCSNNATWRAIASWENHIANQNISKANSTIIP
jgi:hypothetical protein